MLKSPSHTRLDSAQVKQLDHAPKELNSLSLPNNGLGKPFVSPHSLRRRPRVRDALDAALLFEADAMRNGTAQTGSEIAKKADEALGLALVTEAHDVGLSINKEDLETAKERARRALEFTLLTDTNPVPDEEELEEIKRHAKDALQVALLGIPMPEESTGDDTPTFHAQPSDALTTVVQCGAVLQDLQDDMSVSERQALKEKARDALHQALMSQVAETGMNVSGAELQQAESLAAASIGADVSTCDEGTLEEYKRRARNALDLALLGIGEDLSR